MTSYRKAFVIGSTFLAIIFFPLRIAHSNHSVEGTDAINTKNYANTRLEYYYYIPKSIVGREKDKHPLLILIPGLSGRGQEFAGQEFKVFAELQKFIIIAPSFMYDEKNWNSERSYQYPAVWSGNTLLKIIKKFKNGNNLGLSKFYLLGCSAGAQFALRFSLWRPDLCAACAAHASGGTVKPEGNVKVRFFVTVGSRDTPERIEKAKTFCRLARKYGIKVQYREYPVPHELTSAQIADSLEFFKNVQSS